MTSGTAAHLIAKYGKAITRPDITTLEEVMELVLAALAARHIAPAPAFVAVLGTVARSTGPHGSLALWCQQR